MYNAIAIQLYLVSWESACKVGYKYKYIARLALHKRGNTSLVSFPGLTLWVSLNRISCLTVYYIHIIMLFTQRCGYVVIIHRWRGQKQASYRFCSNSSSLDGYKLQRHSYLTATLGSLCHNVPNVYYRQQAKGKTHNTDFPTVLDFLGLSQNSATCPGVPEMLHHVLQFLTLKHELCTLLIRNFENRIWLAT